MNTTTDDRALETKKLGKRYGRKWVLSDCTVTIPKGRVSALVGPNGAGKTTLMSLALGLRRPDAGEVRVLGQTPGRNGLAAGMAFLAQDKPLYAGFTVAEMLRAGQAMNPGFDVEYARGLIDDARVSPKARVKTLSGGQRTRVALAVALGRRPEFIMLDEPLADLDPLARNEVMRVLMAEVAETGATVLLTSHVISDLEGVCDHMVLIDDGRVRLVGDVDELIDEHRVAIGPYSPHGIPFGPNSVVQQSNTDRQSTVLTRGAPSVVPERWEFLAPTLEELVLAYLRTGARTE